MNPLAAQPAGLNLRSHTILLIDDDPADLSLLSEPLAAAGLEVLVARDGESGLHKALYARPQIILLDAVMPGLDGFETCRRLKADAATRDIPVLFMTALAGARDKLRAYEAGAVDYVTKPVQAEELLARVRAHLTLHSMAQYHQEQEARVQQAETARQITEAHSAELRAANRMLRLLSECNQVLVRATNESELLAKICQLIVDLGDYPLVWAGLLDEGDPQTLRLAAHVGDTSPPAVVVIQANCQLEHGPASHAIQSGQPVIVNDLAIDLGYVSLIALPLATDGRVMGALNLYASQPDAFHAEEVNLLLELASDLAYGIRALRVNAEHQHAQAALAEQHRLLRTLIDAMPDRIYVKDADSRFLLANQMVAWIMGTTPENVIGKRDADLYPAELADQYYADEQVLLAAGEPLIDREEPGIDLAGNPHWISTTKVPFRDEAGHIKGFVGIGRDITVRKEMELALRHARDELEARVEERTRELQQLNDRLAGLYQVAQTITAPLQLDVVLDVIARSTAQVLGSDTGVILLLNEEAQTLSIARAYGLSDTVVRGTHDRVGESLAGRVVQTGQPIIANDLPHDARFYNPAAAHEGLLACASVPLIASGKIIGTLDVHSKTKPQAFTPDHIQILSMLASQAASAIENARLYEDLQQAHAELEVRVQQRTAEVAALYRISEATQAAASLDELYAAIHAIVGELMPARNFYIALYDAAANLVSFPYYADEMDTPPQPTQPGRGLTEYVLRSGRPLLATPQRYAELLEQGEVEKIGAHPVDWLGVPLKSQHGETIGVMTAQTYTQDIRLTAAHQAMLVFVSNQVAMAIERKHSAERERNLARNLRAVVAAIDELIACADLDTVLRRAVELAREKLGIERSAIFMYDPANHVMRGTYGTGLERQTTDEHAREFPPDTLAVLLKSEAKPYLVEEKEYVYRVGDRRYTQGHGWVATTVIRFGQQPIGLFSNDTAISRAPLNEATQETLVVYCSLLGNIIERQRAEERITLLNRDLERRTSELTALNRAGRILASTLDLDPLLNLVMEQIKALVDAEAASVLLCVPSSSGEAPSDLVFAAVTGPAAGKLLGTRLPGGAGIAGWVLQTGEVAQISNSQIDARFSQHVDHITGMTTRSLLAVPLIAKGAPVGVMEVINKRSGQFDAHDLEILEALSSSSAIAIENARLYASEQQRAAELTRALEKQRELDRLQREFIQNVSHELRTPIGIILGYAELLESGELGEVNPDHREPIRIITRRTHMLRKLVEDITAILEIEARTRNGQRVRIDLAALAQAAIDEFQIAAEKAQLTLAAEIEADQAPLQGDAVALRRVLDNLVGNAFKFTPAGGRVTVRLRTTDGQAILAVSDTGIGIASDKVERIFDRFYQVDGSATRHYGGMGLGLALVKEIVEAHGGQIAVTSQVNEGTTFTITLPLER
jgi:PAS domain S-box-containing protein